MASSGWRGGNILLVARLTPPLRLQTSLRRRVICTPTLSERRGIVPTAAPSKHAPAILVRNSELLLHQGPPLAFSLRHCTLPAYCILLLRFRWHLNTLGGGLRLIWWCFCAKRLGCKNDFPALLSLRMDCSALGSARVAASVCRNFMELRVCPLCCM